MKDGKIDYKNNKNTLSMPRSHMTSYRMVQKDSDKFDSERFRHILFINIQTIISSERFRLYIRFRRIQKLQKSSATFQNLNFSEC